MKVGKEIQGKDYSCFLYDCLNINCEYLFAFNTLKSRSITVFTKISTAKIIFFNNYFN